MKFGAYFLRYIQMPCTKSYILAVLFSLTYQIGSSQSGAVLKGGIVWKDFERDDKSVFSQSAPGFTAGIEIRLAAEERTYFKPAAYVSRMHVFSQSHFDDTRIFKIDHGYDVLTGAVGLETRLIDAGPIAWRMACSGYVDYIANVRGNVTFEDLTPLLLGLQFKHWSRHRCFRR